MITNKENGSENNIKAYIIGLVVILSGEFLIRDFLLPIPSRDNHISIALAVEWMLFLILILYWIPKVEQKDLDSIGFRKFRFRHIGLGILVYLLYLVVSFASGYIIEAIGLESIRSLQPMISGYNLTTLIGLFLTGTIVEEVFYRGYLINRLTVLSGHRWLAGIISWLLFSLVHLRFFGIGPTLDVSVLSAILVLLYLREDNIWPCIVVHGINGIFVYLLFPILGG